MIFFLKNMINSTRFTLSRCSSFTDLKILVSKRTFSNVPEAQTLDNIQDVKKLLKVAIIGAPNAGKSTLINQIVGRRVFPVSKKVHTTRFKARAIHVENNTQLVFLDTPGLITDKESNKYKLKQDFISGGSSAVIEADVIGVVHDLSNSYTRGVLDSKVLDLLRSNINKESFLILNKIDTLKSKRHLLDISDTITGGKLNQYKATEKVENKNHWEHFSDIFMVSALLGDGTENIKLYLLQAAKPSDWIFEGNLFTDQKPVRIIEETVRSQLLEHLPQEMPYLLNVQLEYLDTNKNDEVVAVVLAQCRNERVERNIKGRKGDRIKHITSDAQMALCDTFLKKVKLKVIVECRQDC